MLDDQPIGAERGRRPGGGWHAGKRRGRGVSVPEWGQIVAGVARRQGAGVAADPDIRPVAAGIVGRFNERLAAGPSASGRLGLVVPAGRPVAHADFVRGWLLGQGALLVSADAGRVTGTTAPPRRFPFLEGQAACPSRAEPIAIRLGDDVAGKLAGSWLILRGTSDRATPMTGTITCAQGTDRCEIQSDEGGFARGWGGGGPTRYDRAWAFGGMRTFRFTPDGGRLSGRVFDDGVHIGNLKSNGITISAQAKGS